MAIKKVILVGTEPPVLLMALLLANKGIPVDVLEQAHELDRPRAQPTSHPRLSTSCDAQASQTSCARRGSRPRPSAGENRTERKSLDWTVACKTAWRTR